MINKKDFGWAFFGYGYAVLAFKVGALLSSPDVALSGKALAAALIPPLVAILMLPRAEGGR